MHQISNNENIFSNLKLQQNENRNDSFKKLLHRQYPSRIQNRTRDISLLKSKKTCRVIYRQESILSLSVPVLKEDAKSIKVCKHSNKCQMGEDTEADLLCETKETFGLASKSTQPNDGKRFCKNDSIGISEFRTHENEAQIDPLCRLIDQSHSNPGQKHSSSQVIKEIVKRHWKKLGTFPKQKWRDMDKKTEEKYLDLPIKSRNDSKIILETFKKTVSLRHEDEMKFFQVIIAYPFHRMKASSKKKSLQRSRNSPMLLSDEASNETYSILNVICPTISVFATSCISFPSTSNSLGVASENVQKARLLGNDPSVRKYGRKDPPYSHPRYKEVNARRATFEGWPSYTQQEPDLLAKNGFYFTGSDDLVRCFCCGIGMKDWSPEDIPHMEHIRHSPNCPFLIDYLGPEMLAIHKQTMHPDGVPEDIEGSESVRRYPVRNTEYITKEAREASFQNNNWPSSVSVTVSQLVEAGLFYTGQGDLCRCFACDGGLQKWEPNDDPWLEHCRWFPSCGYVREVKGDEFVDMVQFVNRGSNQGPTDVSEDDLVGRHVPSGSTAGSQTLRPLVGEKDIEKTVLELGYSLDVVRKAIRDLASRGATNSTADDVVNEIIANQNREEPAAAAAANLHDAVFSNFEYEERERLQKFLRCTQCRDRNVCMLFLPCTHHNLCEECATGLTNCPVCQQPIQEKIKTFLS